MLTQFINVSIGVKDVTVSKCELNAEIGSVVNDDRFAAPCVSMVCREAAGWCLALVHDRLLKYFFKSCRKLI